jgi:hypothetical protein
MQRRNAERELVPAGIQPQGAPEGDRVGVDELRPLHVVKRHCQAGDGARGRSLDFQTDRERPVRIGLASGLIEIAPVPSTDHAGGRGSHALDARQVDPGAR